MASAEPTRIERRCGHRFSQYSIPVTLRTPDGGHGTGFTLDLSCRGALLRTDLPVVEGQPLTMTLVMPEEITLAGNMNVCCKARVLRLMPDRESGKPAVAVRIENFEYLPREVTVLRHDLTASHGVRP
jgi:PilZ domain